MTDDLMEGPATGAACAVMAQIVQMTNFASEPFDVR